MKVCDNASVGVLIVDGAGRLLMIRRVRPPVGIAPPAGHVDEHGRYATPARAGASASSDAWRPRPPRHPRARGRE